MIRPGSSLTKQKLQQQQREPVLDASRKASTGNPPELDSFLDLDDYAGGIALLMFELKSGHPRSNYQFWLAYCFFHIGEYQESLRVFDELSAVSTDLSADKVNSLRLFKACCQYALCNYSDCFTELSKMASTQDIRILSLRNRLLLHVSHKLNNENGMMAVHQNLRAESVEDQICIASLQYLRGHFQEALDLLKRLFSEHKEYESLSVYMALCYYKLDYYDVALDVLNSYLSAHPKSLTALNLKGCCHFQLYSGKAAEAELKPIESVISEHEILKHNVCVFRDGEGALQVFPTVIDSLPEAKLNLVVYHLNREEEKSTVASNTGAGVEEAWKLMRDFEPSNSREHILKAITLVLMSQQTQGQNAKDFQKQAQQLYQVVGSSPSECDTIPGRQSMASNLFLSMKFDEVLIYLRSIKPYMSMDDNFSWNYGISLAAAASSGASNFREALESLLQIQKDSYRRDPCYLTWVVRCYIMVGEPALAWDMFMKAESAEECALLLPIIAHDCYRLGYFYYSCKAFDALERLDSVDPEYWEGKRGAACGVFQQVIANQEQPEKLQEVVELLRNSSNSQVEYLINRVIKKWAKENSIHIE